jgi:hypothetical protein
VSRNSSRRTIVMDDGVWNEIRRVAADNSESISGLIRRVVAEYIEGRESEPPSKRMPYRLRFLLLRSRLSDFANSFEREMFALDAASGRSTMDRAESKLRGALLSELRGILIDTTTFIHSGTDEGWGNAYTRLRSLVYSRAEFYHSRASALRPSQTLGVVDNADADYEILAKASVYTDLARDLHYLLEE